MRQKLWLFVASVLVFLQCLTVVLCHNNHSFVTILDAGATCPNYCIGWGRCMDAAWGAKGLKKLQVTNFDFCQAIFAPPSKWRPWHEPCLTYLIYVTGSQMTKTFRDNYDINIVQETSCEPLFPYVQMQLKCTFLFLLYTHVCITIMV